MVFETYKARLHSLDALRTLAALAVVVAHWPEHFFSVSRFAHPMSDSPFYHWLARAYINGPSAVTFFFALSGFIFYWLYSGPVHARTIGLRHFALLRVSRLYPLHLATLLLLVPLVLIFHALWHFDFVYQYNDAYHFGLNLAFLQYWGFQQGLSWNGPSWSISTEIALYILFFLACRTFTPSVLQATCLMLVAFGLAHFSVITSAAVAFFCGGLTYYGFLAAQRYRSRTAVVAAIVLTMLVWNCLGPLSDGKVSTPLIEMVRHATSFAAFNDLSSRLLQIFCGRVRELTLFPSLIFTCAFVESALPSPKWHLLNGVGNISFGVYLLHFPLQMIIMGVALALSMPSDTFTRPFAFVVFFALLLSLALASYRWLERPAMYAARARKNGATREEPAGRLDVVASK
jgi:peptidoglycan/LPS O-acetylase OafA/YrhL